MNARFLHPSARKDTAAAQAAPAGTAAAAPGEFADCCPAKAVVRVVMARPGQGDLLLCGHHYRASRRALASASATALALPGTPSDIAAWIQLDHHALAAAAC